MAEARHTPDALDLLIQAHMPRYYTNEGHGNVWPRPDGSRSRCGGPKLCHSCASDADDLRDARASIARPATLPITDETAVIIRSATTDADGQAIPDHVPVLVDAGDLRAILAALPLAPREGWQEEVGELRKAWTDYAIHYGPRCRDCADEDGICPATGIPCGGRRKAVEHVVEAILYGLSHGFIAALSRTGEMSRG